jgi:hypothetical protein
MPLIDLWKANPDAVKNMTIEQIVSTAGDGKLRDNSECQEELREFLLEASTDSLEKYSDYCLGNPFNKSGQILQDIVNVLGRRLEYTVENGRYQGIKNEIGYDGIWLDQSSYSLVVEVKTTDAYRLSLNTIARYREALIQCEKIEDRSSVLIVVGRTDTGELEAQVRGSRHAWYMRIISIDSLVKLVRVKESADNQETIGKIKTLLTPIEYTRIDALIDIMFTATKDVENSLEISSDDELTEKNNSSGVGASESKPSDNINEIRERIIRAISVEYRIALIKKTRATYWSVDQTFRVACTISSRHNKQGSTKYWYGHDSSWAEFLDEGLKSYLALGCVDLDEAFLIPNQMLKENLRFMNRTVKKDGSRSYWHIKISENQEGKHFLYLPSNTSETGYFNFPLEDYKISLSETGYFNEYKR